MATINSFILLVLLINPVIIKNLESLEDNNFYEKINNKNRSFVIFYLPTCNNCKLVLSILEKINSDFKKNQKSNDIILYKVDCTTNKFVCYGFNITQVPFMISTFNNKYTIYPTYPSYENLYKFILEYNPPQESLLDIPEEAGCLEMCLILFNQIKDYISSIMSTLLEISGIDYSLNIIQN